MSLYDSCDCHRCLPRAGCGCAQCKTAKIQAQWAANNRPAPAKKGKK